MKKLEITNENYFDKKISKIYTGSSEIKNFLTCEAKAMAELNGEWIEETSDAMLVSSYVDAAISNELDIFKEQHPEIFTKQGELKAQYKNAEEIVKQIKDDPIFYKYLQGESQKIMTGEISGVPVKIKIDSYHPEKLITDLKTIKNFDLIWDEKDKTKKNFIDYYDYRHPSRFVSRDMLSKYRQKVTIRYSSCNERESIAEGIATNSTG